MADDAAALAAAAAVIDDLVSDEHQPVRPDTTDLMGVYAPDAAPVEGEQPAPEAAPEPFALPSWDADTTGIEDLLDEEDDPPLDDEPIYQAPEPASDEWDDDEEKRALKARLAKAERQIEWERNRAAKAAEKEWRAEAARRFPFSDPETIKATSRRGFLRDAAEQHQRVAKKIQPVLDALEATRTETVQEAKLQARVEAAQQWGRPTAGPSAAHVASVQSEEKEIKREDFKSFHEYAKAKLKSGAYGPV